MKKRIEKYLGLTAKPKSGIYDFRGDLEGVLSEFFLFLFRCRSVPLGRTPCSISRRLSLTHDPARTVSTKPSRLQTPSDTRTA